MKKRPAGLWLLPLTLLLCLLFVSERNRDIYSVKLSRDDFNLRYSETYDGLDTRPVTFSGSGAAYRVYIPTMRALSLEKDNYDFLLGYGGADEDTYLKIYSSDFPNPDGKRGKILCREKLNPGDGYAKLTFELGEKSNSVYILVYTKRRDFYLTDMSLESWNPVCGDRYIYCLAALVCAVILFVLLNTNYDNKIIPRRGSDSKKTFLACLFVGASAVFAASLPILGDVLPTGHDLSYHLGRIEGMANSLKTGQFPVRIHSGLLNGFGYPNSYFYPELLLYFPAVLRVLGASVVTRYKFFISLVNAITFIAVYLPFKKLTKSRYRALSLSTVYLLFPYRLVCAYYRRAIGEFSALTFLPMALYGLYRVLKGDKKDWKYLVFGLTGVMQTHMITAVMTVVFFCIVSLFSLKELFVEKRVFLLIGCAFVFFALNAGFILPMLRMTWVMHPSVFSRVQSPAGFAQRDISHMFSLEKLFGLGPHPIGLRVMLLLGFYRAYRIAFVREGEKKKYAFSNLCLVLSAFCLFASTGYFPWKQTTALPLIGKVFDTIQFPYRLESFAIAFAGVRGAALLSSRLKNRTAGRALCVALACVSLLGALTLYDENFVDADASLSTKHYYVNDLGNSLSVGQYEYMPRDRDLDDMVNFSPRVTGPESLVITDFEREGCGMTFNYSLTLSGGEDTIYLPLTAYKGYRIYVNGEETQSLRLGYCRLRFNPTARAGSVRVVYRELFVFRLCEICSVLTFLLLILPDRVYSKALSGLKSKRQKL